MTERPSVQAYIAGPDVFYPNARELADEARTAARKHGITALIPLDNDIEQAEPSAMSAAIFKANVAMIDRADIVVANISPFRGPSADSGTVWEIGYAHGRGKKVYAFTTDAREYKERVGKPDGFMIEDFGGIDNLMISHALESVHPSLDEALAAAAAAAGKPTA